MNVIPEIPAVLNCTLTGYLYDSDDPADLGQTMVEVATTNGILIEAGWIPDGDPNGSYVVTVTDGMRAVYRPYKTTDIREAAKKIESWAAFFSGRPVLRQASASRVIDVVLPQYPQATNVVLPGGQAYGNVA